MDILSAVAGYVFSCILQTIGITLAITTLALVLYFIFSRRGWTRITENDHKWFKRLLISTTTIVGLVIGVVFGTQIAFTNVSVKIVDDLGQTILNQTLTQVVEPLGFSVNEEINLSNMRLLINKVKSNTIISGGGISGRLANSAFDLVKTPFASHAERYVSQLTTTDKIIPAQVVDTVWGKVISTIEFSNRTIILSLLYSALFWLLSITCASIAILSIIRVGYKKAT